MTTRLRDAAKKAEVFLRSTGRRASHLPMIELADALRAAVEEEEMGDGSLVALAPPAASDPDERDSLRAALVEEKP